MVAAGMLMLMVPALAVAETNPYGPAPSATTAPKEEYRPPYTDIGVGVLVGGGIQDFTNSYLNSITDIGGTWTARAIVGTRLPVAVEGSYLGSAQSIHMVGLGGSPLLLSNGLEGDLRFNLSTHMLQPYLFAGVGWRRFNVIDATFNFTGMHNQKDVLESPLGGGIALLSNGFMLDARFDFRPTWFDNFFPTPAQVAGFNTIQTVSMTNWNIALRLGFEF
jgi:hypothetical protein